MQVLDIWLLFVAAGLAAGFFAGLLGIGGGFVVVPVLLLLLPVVGIDPSLSPHFAIGTSLLCICVTALASTRSHQLRGVVDWSLLGLIAPGLVVGSVAGAALAAVLSGRLLVIFFVAGALLTAVYLLSNHRPSAHPAEARWPFVLFSVFTGTISALIGIGGGSVLVPFLVYKGRSMVRSVGTAAASGFPIALFGAATYAVAGWREGIEVEFASGYLYWPAFFGIALFSSLTAPLGARLAHFVSEKRLRQIFAIFLFFTSGQILYSHWF